MLRKDVHLIEEKIVELCSSDWIHNSRWPHYLFHFTDINNAIKILETETLYSRNKAIKMGLMANDNALKEVIDKTNPKKKDYVRLYFRPKTPTQYCNEGFIPKDQQIAHCPMPIMFLFNSISILSDDKTCFSNGNIAAKSTIIYSSTKDYLQLNFKDIYHNSTLYGYSDSRSRDIKNHRHAEVLIKDQIGLNNLKFICCRSHAEYETLRNMLKQKNWEKWAPQIIVDTKNACFYNNWPFISNTVLDSKKMVVSFNFKDSFPQIAKIYDLRTERLDRSKKIQYTRNLPNFLISETSKSFQFDFNKLSENYNIKIFIDNHIAYQNDYKIDEGLI